MTYHDLHITTATFDRTSIFNLPYGIEVVCSRIAGWQLWMGQTLMAGEYDPENWLILDVAGQIIVNSREITV